MTLEDILRDTPESLSHPDAAALPLRVSLPKTLDIKPGLP